MRSDQTLYTRLSSCVCVLKPQSKWTTWRKWACLGVEPLSSVALVAQQLNLKTIYILLSAPPTDSSTQPGSTDERRGGKWDLDLFPAVYFSARDSLGECEMIEPGVDFHVASETHAEASKSKKSSRSV